MYFQSEAYNTVSFEKHLTVVYTSLFATSSPLVRIGSFRLTFAFSHRREHVAGGVLGELHDVKATCLPVIAHRLRCHAQVIRQLIGTQERSLEVDLVVEMIGKVFDFSQNFAHVVAWGCVKIGSWDLRIGQGNAGRGPVNPPTAGNLRNSRVGHSQSSAQLIKCELRVLSDKRLYRPSLTGHPTEFARPHQAVVSPRRACEKQAASIKNHVR